MAQEKTAEIIDLSATRAAAAASDGAGAFLASARLGAGYDIAAVSEATKIKAAHIEAIEAGDAARLPATPYAVGFVKVYARFLGLDANAVAADFKRELEAARPAVEPDEPAPFAAAVDASAGVKAASLVGIVLIGAFAIWIAVQIAGNAERTRAGAEAAAAEGPRVTVSTERADAPRPRVISASDYAVAPIPQAFSTADNAAGAETAEPMIALDRDALPAPSLGPRRSTRVAEAAPAEPAAPETAPAAAAPTEGVAPEGASSEDAAPMLAPAIAPVQPDPAATIAAPREPVIIDARLTRSIGPEYPAACRAEAGALETVSLIFDVNATGRTANPRVTTTTDSCFNEAAVAAVTKWRFDPRTVDGAPRPQTGVQATLNFRK